MISITTGRFPGNVGATGCWSRRFYHRTWWFFPSDPLSTSLAVLAPGSLANRYFFRESLAAAIRCWSRRSHQVSNPMKWTLLRFINQLLKFID